MKSKSGKLITFMAGILALFIFFSSVFHSSITTAASFIDNLPAGYQVYSGRLLAGRACTCSTGGISGGPPPLPPCNIDPCFGSSITRYAWVDTKVPGIDSAYCDERRKTIPQGTPPCFELDGDDALIISGSMSPIQALTYYSFTFYQGFTNTTQAAPDSYELVQASVNLGLNNTSLKQGPKGKYVVVATASTHTFNAIKKALNATGVPNEIINSYYVPASVTDLGTIAYPNQLSFLLRLSSQNLEERNQVNAFVQETIPATKVTFVKGPRASGNITFDNIPKWENRLRATDIEYKLGLDRSLAALEQAVTNVYAQQGYTVKARLPESPFRLDTTECRTTPVSCAYDSPDALYSSYPCDFSPTALKTGNCYYELRTSNNNDDVLMLLGVNHSLVGYKTLIAYSSEESKPIPGSKDGSFSFIGLSTQGSANQYLSTQNAANLYAVKIARDCGTEAYCAPVPFLGNADDITGFYLNRRLYLDKVTRTAPNPANLVPSILIWFERNT
jgi:hypothetical protein